jgi:transposase, IS30 family
MNYQHFSIEEREQIQKGVWEKESIRAIAKRLVRSPSSVAREIVRNLPPERYQYTPRVAHARALAHRTHRGRTERLKDDAIRSYVVTHLKLRWSPEQIAGTMRNDLGMHISHEAIYQFVYARVNLYGVVKGEDLRPYLRRRRKRRVPKGARRCQRIKPYGISIEARPSVVAEKARYGDWEGDTVASHHNLTGVNTLLERKSGMLLVTKLSKKDAHATVRAVAKRFATLPARMTRTLTLDNGPENSDWKGIEASTGAQCFFAHPYASHERGANENANGILREYFPKGTDFRMISPSQLRAVERSINTRPRKRLGWKTPLEVFRVALRS